MPDMISAVIATLNDEAGLEATLAALTAPAIDGFVREVIVADAGSTDATLAIAEEAGARIVRASGAALVEGCAAARQPWFLLLKAGTRPQAGWEQAAWRHVNDHSDRAGWFTLSLKAGGPGARLDEARANLGAQLFGRPRAEQGLLVPRRLYDELLKRRGGPVSLPLRLGPGVLRPLGARILA